MTSLLGQKYWDLPSVQAFTERVIDSLRARKSSILIVPPLIDKDLLMERFDLELWKADFSRHDIHLDEQDINATPLEIINKEFCSDLDKKFPKPLSEIMSLPEIPDVVVLIKSDKYLDQNLKQWFDIFQEWADQSHQKTSLGIKTPALFAIVDAYQAVDILPPRKLFLDYYWWWGFPSALEINLLCRSENKYFGGGNSNLWKEKLLSSLSPGDLGLIEHLWDSTDTNFIDILNGIRSYEVNYTNLDDEINKIQSFEKPGYITNLPALFPGDAPPRKIQKLWSMGNVYATIEYGVEYHPSVLIHKNTEAIQHRLWRSQSDLLLPIIDNLRITVCHDLTQKLGREWPYEWETPLDIEDLENVKENPMSAQLGYIVHLLSTNPHFRGSKSWLSISKKARDFRNQIAHYKVIEKFDQLNLFIQSVTSVYEKYFEEK